MYHHVTMPLPNRITQTVLKVKKRMNSLTYILINKVEWYSKKECYFFFCLFIHIIDKKKKIAPDCSISKL